MAENAHYRRDPNVLSPYSQFKLDASVGQPWPALYGLIPTNSGPMHRCALRFAAYVA